MTDNDKPLEPGSSAWRERVAEVERQTTVPGGAWWYLTFVDPSLPEETQFLGSCYVRGDSLPDAVTRSHQLGINPGGEVAITQVDETIVIPEQFQERLLTADEDDECDSLIDELEEDEWTEDIIRAKWIMDGATTLSECAEQLRAYADWLVEMEGKGHQLVRPVDDDYGFVQPLFPRDEESN